MFLESKQCIFISQKMFVSTVALITSEYYHRRAQVQKKGEGRDFRIACELEHQKPIDLSSQNRHQLRSRPM